LRYHEQSGNDKTNGIEKDRNLGEASEDDGVKTEGLKVVDVGKCPPKASKSIRD